MYSQSLYSVVTPIKQTTLSRLNKSKKWKYGYNKEHDVVVISKTGQIGDIYNIQNLNIALPKAPSKLDKTYDKWTPTEYPRELKLIKSIFDWREYPIEFKEKYYDYIDKEFTRREERKRSEELARKRFNICNYKKPPQFAPKFVSLCVAF